MKPLSQNHAKIIDVDGRQILVRLHIDDESEWLQIILTAWSDETMEPIHVMICGLEQTQQLFDSIDEKLARDILESAEVTKILEEQVLDENGRSRAAHSE